MKIPTHSTRNKSMCQFFVSVKKKKKPKRQKGGVSCLNDMGQRWFDHNTWDRGYKIDRMLDEHESLNPIFSCRGVLRY